jgi:rfaE bifunctional protein kinase chain/domain
MGIVKMGRKLRDQYLDLLGRFRGCPIAVYGDLVADEFVYGEISRISREAPVLILRHKESRIVPGGGANAVNNLRALGALPVPVGVLGLDIAGQELRNHFSSLKIQLSLLQQFGEYQTPTKTRYSAGSVHSSRQQVLRIDKETVFQHTAKTQTITLRLLERALKDCRGILISDYGFGFVSPQIVRAMSQRNKRNLPITLDSRFNLLDFQGLTGATPNEPEVEASLGIKIGTNTALLELSGRKLLRKLKMSALLITRGRDGMALFESGKKSVHIPIFGTDEIADVTGAGDTVIAVFTLALAVGASFPEAARLSNYAGGIVVMKHGTATVSLDELRQAILEDQALQG